MNYLVLLIGGVAALLLLTGVLVLVILLQSRKGPPTTETLPSLDVATLAAGDIPDAPQLEIYNLPMRLSAVVAAPAGRGAELPEVEGLADELDLLSPGFREVFVHHAPKLIIWPAQLSTEGFVHSFFRQVPLPGDRGKGSPWCSLAGRIESADHSLLVGLVCRADSSNSLGQIVVERSSKWLDMVRVRNA